jgi:hypothetical protein
MAHAILFIRSKPFPKGEGSSRVGAGGSGFTIGDKVNIKSKYNRSYAVEDFTANWKEFLGRMC